MKKICLFFLGLFLVSKPVIAQEGEPLNFNISFHGGGGYCTGFLGTGAVVPEGGLWLGISLSDRFDGLWGIDYYALPGQEIPVTYGTPRNPVVAIMPTDDIALSVNTRWYWADKVDRVHQKFNTVPYLVGGLGMDLVVDQDPRPLNSRFYNLYFDPLFAVNLGAGMDFPLDKQWYFFAEGLDHLILWQGLTQVFSIRTGFKVMLDSAHVDPFR